MLDDVVRAEEGRGYGWPHNVCACMLWLVHARCCNVFAFTFFFELFQASFSPVSNAAATQTHLIIRKEEHKVGPLSSVARG
jgi:hypothetical protein